MHKGQKQVLQCLQETWRCRLQKMQQLLEGALQAATQCMESRLCTLRMRRQTSSTAQQRSLLCQQCCCYKQGAMLRLKGQVQQQKPAPAQTYYCRTLLSRPSCNAPLACNVRPDAAMHSLAAPACVCVCVLMLHVCVCADVADRSPVNRNRAKRPSVAHAA